jgi:hypothetical protein
VKFKNLENPKRYTVVVTINPIKISVKISVSVVVDPEKNSMLVSKITVNKLPILRPIRTSSIGYLCAIMIPRKGINDAIIRILSSSV